ncbi:MAG: domain containing protein [Solirubrobacteraceae bacterium]|nr:domain containing protein [Solirubrobacteraceae bacterium]
MGFVERILIRDEPAGTSRPVERVQALEGLGLQGDRYFNGEGTFFEDGKSGQALTLIEAEALEGLQSDTGIALTAEEAGRNVVTRGVDLNALVGRRFRIGDIECRGDRLCDPCATLARRTDPGVLRGLAGRGGLRADILHGGELVTGTEVDVVE